MKKMKNYMFLALSMALVILSGCSQDEFNSNESKSSNLESVQTRSASLSLNYIPAVYISLYDGTSSENPYWKCTDFMPVDISIVSSTIGVYGVEDNAGGQVVFWYDASKKFIKADLSKFKTEFTTPSNAAYMRINQHVSYPNVPLYKLYNESLDGKEQVALSYDYELYYYPYTGVPSSSPYWKSTKAMPVRSTDVYAVDNNNGGQVLFWFDIAGKFIQSNDSKVKTKFVTPANAATLLINQHVSYATVPLYKLVPKKNLIQAYLYCRSINDKGQVESGENCYWKYTDFISVDAGMYYSIPENKGGQTIFWYDNSSTPKFISKYSTTSGGNITPPAKAAYIRVLQHTEYADVPVYRVNDDGTI